MNERLKELRKKLNLSQEAFGRKLGVTGAGISKIESGDRNLTDQMILSICRAYDVNEEWLRYGENPIFIKANEEEEILALFKRIITKLDKDELKKVKEFLELFLKK